MSKIDVKTIQNLALELGFPLCGVMPLSEGQLSVKEEERLRAWQEAGFGADMAYMNREAVERCDATYHHSWVTTVLSFAIPYSSIPPLGPTPIGYGRVARYAWGRDYHRILKKKLSKLGDAVKKEVSSEVYWRPVTDSFPLLERAFAKESGLGFVGKNTMLIRPKFGSFFFLAEVLTNLDVFGRVVGSSSGGCGTCTRCIEVCPTGAFEAPYVLNANKCISYLTIEKRGDFSPWEREAIGEWLFGCDLCQEVCPFNHIAQKSVYPEPIEEFRPESGVGSFISLNTLFSLRTDEEFMEFFQGTPLTRPGRLGILRNALCVAANQKAVECGGAIEELVLRETDSSLRELASWALLQMNSVK